MRAVARTAPVYKGDGLFYLAILYPVLSVMNRGTILFTNSKEIHPQIYGTKKPDPYQTMPAAPLPEPLPIPAVEPPLAWENQLSIPHLHSEHYSEDVLHGDVRPQMNKQHHEAKQHIMAETGVMPEHGMLAAAYVPEQRMSSPRYDKDEAFKNGTLFPGLNLPYGQYYPTKEVAKTPQGEVMALSFVISDLGLYLDTHPGDMEALKLRNSFIKMRDEAQKKLSKEYGPVISETVMEDGYSWIDTPWPWEK